MTNTKIRKAPEGAKPSASASKRWVIEQLSKFYTEALCKNPKDSVYDNIERAVERLPVVANSWELLEALENSQQYLQAWLLEPSLDKFRKEAVKYELERNKAAIAKTRGQS